LNTATPHATAPGAYSNKESMTYAIVLVPAAIGRTCVAAGNLPL